MQRKWLELGTGTKQKYPLMVKWIRVVKALTTTTTITTVTWFMEITSPLHRRFQLIIGEFSRGSQRPRAILVEEWGAGGGEGVCVCVVTLNVFLVRCLFRKYLRMLLVWHGEWTWRAILKNTISSKMTGGLLSLKVLLYKNDMTGPGAIERGRPRGCDRLLLFLSRSVLTSVGHGRASASSRAGWEKHYFDSDPSS